MGGKAYEQKPANPSGLRTAIIAVGLCVVTMAGCGSAANPEPSTSPAAAPSPKLTTPSPPLTPTAYQEKLRDTSSALAPAFTHLSAAASLEDARAALDETSSAASEAARLLNVDPPPDVLPAHRDLLAGLRRLTTDMSALSGQVESMELCAMPSVLPSVSNATGVNSLRTVRDELRSGRLDPSYQWGEFLPAPTPLLERRLANGRLVDNQRRNGRGQLKIDNGAEHDAVVKLVQSGRPIVSVYVRHNSKATVEQISDGNYQLFYTSGTDWDDRLRTFTRSCQFQRFEQTANFSTTSVRGGIQYTVQSVGLKPRIGGNARTEKVPAQSFPR